MYGKEKALFLFLTREGYVGKRGKEISEQQLLNWAWSQVKSNNDYRKLNKEYFHLP